MGFSSGLLACFLCVCVLVDVCWLFLLGECSPGSACALLRVSESCRTELLI